MSVKIADYMEHFPVYSNLEGLKAINITKKTDKGIVGIPIDNGGEVKDYLENGNILYCDLKTDEYWIKTSINMTSNHKKLSISLDIKNRMEMPMKKLKMNLKKLSFWKIHGHMSLISKIHSRVISRTAFGVFNIGSIY